MNGQALDAIVADLGSVCPTERWRPLMGHGDGPFGDDPAGYPGPGALFVWHEGFDPMGEAEWCSARLWDAWIDECYEPWEDPYGRMHPGAAVLAHIGEAGPGPETWVWKAFAEGWRERFGEGSEVRQALWTVAEAICVPEEPSPPEEVTKLGAVRPGRPAVEAPDMFGAHTPRDAKRLAVWEKKAQPWIEHDRAMDAWRASTRKNVDWEIRKRIRQACGFTGPDDLAIDVGMGQ